MKMDLKAKRGGYNDQDSVGTDFEQARLNACLSLAIFRRRIMSNPTTSGNQSSTGPKWSIVASLLVILAFFLPWVRACGADLSGLDLATNKIGNVEDPWAFWLTLLAGLICLALTVFSRPKNRAGRTRNAWLRVCGGAFGAVPPLTILWNVLQRQDILELLYGWWLTVVGLAGILVSAALDLFQPPEAVDEVKVDFSQEAGGDDG
jgi:hypothetical protein